MKKTLSVFTFCLVTFALIGQEKYEILTDFKFDVKSDAFRIDDLHILFLDTLGKEHILKRSEDFSPDRRSPDRLSITLSNKKQVLADLDGKILSKEYDFCSTSLNNVYIFSNKEKFGLLDRMGKDITAFMYNSIETFDYKCKFPFFSAQLNDKYGVIDNTGKIIVNFDFNTHFSYDKDLNKIKNYKDSLLFIFDEFGNKKIQFRLYTWDDQGNKKIFNVKTGKRLTLDTYSDVDIINDSLFIVRKRAEEKTALIDWNGNILVPFGKYYHISGNEYGNLLRVTNDFNKWGFIDRYGKEIIPFEFDDAESYNPLGVAIVQKDSLFGLIDKNGKLIIPFKYNELDYDWGYNNELITAKKGNKYGLVDTNDKEVTEFIFDGFNTNWKYINIYQINKKQGYISKQGKILTPPLFDFIGGRGEYTIAQKDKKFGAFDKNLNPLLPFEFERLDVINEAYILPWNFIFGEKDGKYALIKLKY